MPIVSLVVELDKIMKTTQMLRLAIAPGPSTFVAAAKSTDGGQDLGHDRSRTFFCSIRHCELSGRWGGGINFGVSLPSHLFSMNLVIALLAQVFQTRVSNMLVRDLEAPGGAPKRSRMNSFWRRVSYASLQ